MRPDGKRVKDLPPIVAAIPYIMPKRYDAWNTITENIDEEVVEEISDWFRHEAASDSLEDAVRALGDYEELEIRLVRIKFLSEVAN